MAQPNQALLTVTKARLYQSIRQRFHNDTEDQLFDDFDEALPSERERQIDALFSNTINQIIVGYAFRSKLLSLTGGTSFGPALNNLRQYDYLSVRQKRRLCNRISRIKTVYENWDTLKVEKFACTNFRENKISRGLIFATEDFNYFAVTYFREFRE